MKKSSGEINGDHQRRAPNRRVFPGQRCISQNEQNRQHTAHPWDQANPAKEPHQEHGDNPDVQSANDQRVVSAGAPKVNPVRPLHK
jgi:hypothetical protein